jgi:hypothetical protein
MWLGTKHVAGHMNGCEVILKSYCWLGAVALACNPSSSGGRDGKDHSLRPVCEALFNQQKLGVCLSSQLNGKCN